MTPEEAEKLWEEVARNTAFQGNGSQAAYMKAIHDFKSALREEIDKLDDWATMHLDDGEMIGFKRACSEIEEKLDSLTPNK